MLQRLSDWPEDLDALALEDMQREEPLRRYQKHNEYGKLKAARLEAAARRMRRYNLTHGSGCKSKARAIEIRLKGKSNA